MPFLGLNCNIVIIYITTDATVTCKLSVYTRMLIHDTDTVTVVRLIVILIVHNQHTEQNIFCCEV